MWNKGSVKKMVDRVRKDSPGIDRAALSHVVAFRLVKERYGDDPSQHDLNEVYGCNGGKGLRSLVDDVVASEQEG